MPTDAELMPLAADELAALPFFPLPRCVMLPGCVVPLHLFEPRYRAMVADCLASRRPVLALAMLEPGWEGSYEGRPPVRTIAGAGRIIAHRAHPDGTFDIVLRGVTRVQLDELPAEGQPYRRARASVLEDGTPLDGLARQRVLAPVLATLAALEAMRARDVRRESDPLDLSGPLSLVVDRLADRCLRNATLRQQILEEVNVVLRAKALEDALAGSLAALSATHRGMVEN